MNMQQMKQRIGLKMAIEDGEISVQDACLKLEQQISALLADLTEEKERELIELSMKYRFYMGLHYTDYGIICRMNEVFGFEI